jgi:hypothetical protein
LKQIQQLAMRQTLVTDWSLLVFVVLIFIAHKF